MFDLPIPQIERPLEAFLQNFDDLFARSETRSNMQRYVRGLLADVKRKNG